MLMLLSGCRLLVASAQHRWCMSMQTSGAAVPYRPKLCKSSSVHEAMSVAGS